MNDTSVKERDEERETLPFTYTPPPYPELVLQDVKFTLVRVRVFDSLTLPFTAVPFTDEEVILENVDPLRDVVVVVVMEESEEEGEISRIDVLRVREEEEEEEGVTIIDSNERIPDDWKSNGQLSDEMWNVIELNVIVVDGVEITNTPDGEVSDIDPTLLLTEELLCGWRVVE